VVLKPENSVCTRASVWPETPFRRQQKRLVIVNVLFRISRDVNDHAVAICTYVGKTDKRWNLLQLLERQSL
jgi:hypothetical protein